MSATLTEGVLGALIEGLEMDLPAKRMFATSAGRELEQTADLVMDARRKSQQNRRKRRQRDREQREAAIAADTPQPESLTAEQQAQSWRVVGPLWPVIEKVAAAKVRQAARLGSVVQTDDVTPEVTDQMCLVVHAGGLELFGVDTLAEAAHELAGNALNDEEHGSARKWLMQRLNVITQRAVVMTDMAAREVLSLDDLRHAEAVEAALTRIDSFYDAFHASRTCHLEGARYVGPGELDWFPLLVVITEAITAKGLDPITDVILDNLRSDGTVKWRECAQQVFEADPQFEGAWPVIVQATSGFADPEARQAVAARDRARVLFGWLPELISSYVA